MLLPEQLPFKLPADLELAINEMLEKCPHTGIALFPSFRG